MTSLGLGADQGGKKNRGIGKSSRGVGGLIARVNLQSASNLKQIHAAMYAMERGEGLRSVVARSHSSSRGRQGGLAGLPKIRAQWGSATPSRHPQSHSRRTAAQKSCLEGSTTSIGRVTDVVIIVHPAPYGPIKGLLDDRPDLPVSRGKSPISKHSFIN